MALPWWGSRGQKIGSVSKNEESLPENVGLASLGKGIHPVRSKSFTHGNHMKILPYRHYTQIPFSHGGENFCHCWRFAEERSPLPVLVRFLVCRFTTTSKSYDKKYGYLFQGNKPICKERPAGVQPLLSPRILRWIFPPFLRS